MTGGISLAYDSRQRVHYVLRVVSPEALAWDGSLDCGAALNGLLETKTARSLLDGISQMTSLCPDGVFWGQRYMFTQKEARRSFPKRFSSCEAGQLQAELWLDSAGALRSDKSKLSKFVEEFGTDGGEFLEALLPKATSADLVLAERLQDWITLRNSLSLCARLLGQIEGGGGAISLERAGFYNPGRNEHLGGSFYMIPFKFNTYFAATGVDGPDVHDPLFTRVAPPGKRAAGDGRLFRTSVNYPDPKRPNVFLATRPAATESFPESVADLLVSKRREPAEKVYYLMVEDSGDHMQMACDIVNAFTRGFRTLDDPVAGRGEPRKLGWVYDETGNTAKLPQPRLEPRSLPSALWYSLLFHPAMKMVLCKRCGNAILSREKGTPKAYCSETCRVQDANQRRNARESG